MTDPRLSRFVLAHLLTVIGEWAATVGVLGGSVAVFAACGVRRAHLRPRTATVRSRGDGVLLGINREAFLIAVTGHDRSHAVALAHVDKLDLDDDVRRQMHPNSSVDGADTNASGTGDDPGSTDGSDDPSR